MGSFLPGINFRKALKMSALRLTAPLLLGLLAAGCTPRAEKDLLAAFGNPPQQARPVVLAGGE